MAFDQRVSQAVDIIYGRKEFRRGQEAFDLLQAAAADGDADAYFLLGRCYAGSAFVDERFNFVEDEALTDEYFNRSIEMGSAVAMFAARRLGGFRPRCGSFIQPPYNSNREVWDAVVSMALEGEVFCELILANAYYYGDAIELMGFDKQNMPVQQKQYLLANMAITARDIYEDIYNKGMLMAVWNYKDIITSGDFGVPKDGKRYKWLRKLCSKRGIDI